jgi:hypothetical protein
MKYIGTIHLDHAYMCELTCKSLAAHLDAYKSSFRLEAPISASDKWPPGLVIAPPGICPTISGRSQTS